MVGPAHGIVVVGEPPAADKMRVRLALAFATRMLPPVARNRSENPSDAVPREAPSFAVGAMSVAMFGEVNT